MPDLKLARAPIIEAVIDIDCDMPPGFSLARLEPSAQEAFREPYSKSRVQLLQEQQIEQTPGQPPKVSAAVGIQALQFLQNDEKQLVQIRANGWSFNRLAPYSTFDDYLPEVERTWKLFLALASPVQVRLVRLRYINRIVLPFQERKLELQDYLRIGPQLPDETNLTFAGFLNQHTAMETTTGHWANIVLAAQSPGEDNLPIIFDIAVAATGPAEVQDWAWIIAKIQALRGLKNKIFKNTLTDKCLNLFQ